MNATGSPPTGGEVGRQAVRQWPGRTFLAKLHGPIVQIGIDLLGFAFPAICSLCGTPLGPEEHVVCQSCFSRIEFIVEPFCPRCSRPVLPGQVCLACRGRSFAFSEARALGMYEGVLGELVQLVKYKHRRGLARRLGLLMGRSCGTDYVRGTSPALIPVPLHGARFRERGFNQSEDLARAVSEAAGLPLLTGALVRRFPTRSQTELSPEQRAENVARAFQVRDRGAVRGRTIILVDDVFTTGATLDACARQLWECGAEEIKVLAAAVACLR